MAEKRTFHRMHLSLDFIVKEMAKLEWYAQRKVMRKVLRRVLRPVQKRAAASIPKPGYPGDKPEYAPLNKQMRIVVRQYRQYTWYAAVGATWPEGAHSHLVHDGVKEHSISAPGKGPRSKNASTLANLPLGEGFGREVIHPGHEGNPFLADAWDALKAQVEAELARQIGEEVTKEFAKVSRKAGAK